MRRSSGNHQFRSTFAWTSTSDALFSAWTTTHAYKNAGQEAHGHFNMHSVLRITELVDLVLDHIDRPRDLYSVARTCKAFKELSLDHLWRTQNTLDNIVQCLPPELWEMRAAQDTFGCHVHLSTEAKPSDWTVALTYSRRIRVLVVEESHRMPCSTVLEAIRVIGPSKLLPNLKDVRFCATIHPYEDVFLLPTVRHLHLGDVQVPSLPATMDSAMNWERVIGMSLVSDPDEAPAFVSSAMSTIAKMLQRIQILELDCISSEAFVHLARLPHLTALRFRTTMEDDALAELAQALFPALEHLSVHDTTLEYASKIVNLLLPSSPIEGLNLETSPSTKEEAAALYSAVASHINPATLRTLVLGTSVELTDVIMPYAVDANLLDNFVVQASAIRPLLQFSGLEELALQPSAGFNLDCQLAWDMARAWPNLTHLVLVSASRARISNPALRLSALQAFVHHSLNLVHLELDLDATYLPAKDELSLQSQKALRVLAVGISPIRQPEPVAAFLRSIFPATELSLPSESEWDLFEQMNGPLDVHGMEGRLFQRQWTKVANLLKAGLD
ncbi:hypothetical protein MIND_01317900 [Mycena indigotica]|uniref:F-box domain-containing protein n=1 Tax=Mycena indigotica TaxID=2126181 RepID=A0A8H6S3R6_9AGAR|nr:uncharacterized protein MIND_01317900 [Mycena indigotica]KAF7290770.1 hypothetical protein MIND_01317900 [Mycena indigotica]